MIAWLKGDYVGKHERQEAAKKRRCDVVLSFHFNSASSPLAAGAEVFYNDKPGAKELARELLEAITTAIPVPKRGIKAAARTRAAFINHYHCPAVLMEPLFLSNPREAELVHDLDTVRRLASAIAKVVHHRGYRRIGIDIGHKFKTSNPNDTGASCVFARGCTEAFHAEHLAKAVASVLNELASEAKDGK